MGAVDVGKAELVRVISGVIDITPSDKIAWRQDNRGIESVSLESRDVFDDNNVGEQNIGYNTMLVHGSCTYLHSASNTYSTSRSDKYLTNYKGHVINLSNKVSMVFTAVPYERAVEWIEEESAGFDLAVLVLNCNENMKNNDNTKIESVQLNVETNENKDRTATVLSEEKSNRSDLQENKKDLTDTFSRFIDMEKDNNELTVNNVNNVYHTSNSDDVEVILLYKVRDVMTSLLSAQRLEALLPNSLPRIYVANNSHLLSPQSIETNTFLSPAIEYLQNNQLPPLIYVSSDTKEGIENMKLNILRVAVCPEIGIPVLLRKQPDRTAFYVMCSIAAILAVSTIALFAGKAISKQSIKGGWTKLLPKFSFLSVER